MQRSLFSIASIIFVALAASAVWFPDGALAQTEAQSAFKAAQTAFEEGKFAQAEELAEKASQTDPKNPEVFLLWGKAQYQLGHLDEALAAWKQTLKLAPQEPYAAGMLAALRSQQAGIDSRIKLIEVMLDERLYPSALRECLKVLDEKATGDAQRAKVMTMQADLLMKMGKYPEAQKTLKDLAILYPKQLDPAKTALIAGQAKLHGDEQAVAEAIVTLKKVIADHPNHPAAVCAQYKLLAHDLKQGIDTVKTEALAAWLSAHPEHKWSCFARERLLKSYLSLTCQGAKPKNDAKLSKSDTMALAVFADLYKRGVKASQRKALTERLLKHVLDHYTQNGAYNAALAATESLLAVPLNRADRLSVLESLASRKQNIAMRWLTEQSRKGLFSGNAGQSKLPKVLAEVVAVYETIRKEYPSELHWQSQIHLAGKVNLFAAKVPWPQKVTSLRSPEVWALEIAWPVVKANADYTAVKEAVKLIMGIVDQVPRTDATTHQLAASLSGKLVETLPPDHTMWRKAVFAFYKVEADYASYLFQENIKSGHAAENAKLSAPQEAILSQMEKHLTERVEHAPLALSQLAEFTNPMIANGHWTLAEKAYLRIAKVLPKTQQHEAELTVARLWMQQATQKHQRLSAAGLTVPRQLDPLHRKVLSRCYILQSQVADSPVELQMVRNLTDQVVNHYKRLEYYDVAKTAIEVKVATTTSGVAADEYADFSLIRLKDELARRDLQRLLKQYGASEKADLETSFEEVIAAWTKFIADRPTSSLVPQAVNHIFAVGQLFEQKGVHGGAAKVYGNFAKAASKIDVLCQSTPPTVSTVQRAAFAAATALETKARVALAKLNADRKGDDPPPKVLSKEYMAAIKSYKEFITAYPDSSLIPVAIDRVMAVAYEYAKLDAWDVADSVYADLLKSGLKIRRPERLTFARGLCQLGHAMPQHAREILQVLTGTGLRDSEKSGEEGEQVLAMNGPAMGGGMGMGGGMMGGMGGMAGGMGGMGFDMSGRTATSKPASQAPRGRAGGYAVNDLPARAGEPASQCFGTPAVELPMDGSPPAETAISEEGLGRAKRDGQLLAMIQRQESNRASQVARLRESTLDKKYSYTKATSKLERFRSNQQQGRSAPEVLSPAELVRQEKAINAAYKIFQGICKQHPHTSTAKQARGEILVMVAHWRGLGQWQRSASLAMQFLKDNPTDLQLPKLRLEIARDRLAWASKSLKQDATKQEMLVEVCKRFDTARAELAKIVKEFPKQKTYQQQAQWEIASSFLTQARVVESFSSTLARGQYVRAAKELGEVAEKYPDHPQISSIPQRLWTISAELKNRGYYEEAILVWNELVKYNPMHQFSQQAAMEIAQTYHHHLQRPLRAAEAYQELNFARGGNDQNLQNAIFQIGSELKNQKRWVEALHVLESFVDSFPKHQQAGQALTMVGQIHQTNEAWKDAIDAYRRVIAEFKNGQWSQDAKWAIAECTINLSQWHEATEAYQIYIEAFPKDSKVQEAKRRIELLKDLERYQGLVNEKGQRKAFDAQYQIAVIVGQKLSNPIKSIIEYRKVTTTWPQSHLADDALYEIGTIYLSLGETELAREALLEMAKKYPASPLADDALFMVGKSYESEATKLATVNKATTIEKAREVAQRRAYSMSQSNRRDQIEIQSKRIAGLKKSGKGKAAEEALASSAANYAQFNDANVILFAQKAYQEVESLSASQLADRQDKINAALRKAVESFTSASKVAGADKADEALLQMATIYDTRLKDSDAAMQTWLEIVRQFSGTAVAEDASWRIAQHYQREGKYADAIEAYQAFLRNYRRSPKAAAAQFAVAENNEKLDQWVKAMDAYTNYITNFPKGPLAGKAKEQINWIKTYRL